MTLTDVELYCSDLKIQGKQNQNTIYLVFTVLYCCCNFLFNFRYVKLNRKLVNRGRHNNVYVLMQMEFFKTTIKLFQCYFSLK